MTLIDRVPELVVPFGPEASTGVDVRHVYDAPYGDHEVVVVGSADVRAAQAFQIEKDNMVLLGDAPENADRDLRIGYADASFLTLFRKGESEDPANMLGVVRITDANPITKHLITVEQVTELTGEDYDQVFAHVVAETGQDDPTKIYDINTYGLSGDVITRAFEGDRTLFDDAKGNLMFAMCREGIRAARERKATTALAFFNQDSIKAFTKRGYDWRTLNGYKPMQEVRPDSQGNIVRGLTLVPTILDIPEHVARMRAGVTPHLKDLADFMTRQGVDLSL